jgi:hypothetical protein
MHGQLTILRNSPIVEKVHATASTAKVLLSNVRGRQMREIASPRAIPADKGIHFSFLETDAAPQWRKAGEDSDV